MTDSDFIRGLAWLAAMLPLALFDLWRQCRVRVVGGFGEGRGAREADARAVR